MQFPLLMFSTGLEVEIHTAGLIHPDTCYFLRKVLMRYGAQVAMFMYRTCRLAVVNL